ncbi:MAG: hypothetical protein KJ667_04825 [Alphaproteobacteria bacterium]|nr:hypothetical protein [Alphaproteobacteria bacterium]
MIDSEEISTRLQACIDRLDDAILATRNGEAVSIVAMEAEVEALCNAISHAPIQTGHAVQGLVAGMIARLDMLESDLRTLRDNALRETEE